MSNDARVTGEAIRRQVLGDRHVDAAFAGADGFTRDFQDFLTGYAWGEIWGRPGLDRRMRSAITVAMLATLRAEHELAMHTRAALRNGLTVGELREVLLQVAIYAGVPAANTAFQVAQRVLKEEGAIPRGTGMTGEVEREGEFVQSLARGLSVIRAFDADHSELTLSEVAKQTGLTRAAARRFLHTLVELGYMRGDNGKFKLRPKILELGYAYLSSLSLPEMATPHLEQLVERVHESSSVSVLDGDEVVYIARVPTRRIMTVAISVGTRFPAYATSMGRVLLAARSDQWLDGYFASTKLRSLTSHTISDPDGLRRELARVRTQGWALVDQELEEGLRSIAAPIRDQDGRVIAAVNVSTSALRRDLDQVVADLLDPLLSTARRIEEDLASSAGHRDWI